MTNSSYIWMKWNGQKCFISCWASIKANWKLDLLSMKQKKAQTHSQFWYAYTLMFHVKNDRIVFDYVEYCFFGERVLILLCLRLESWGKANLLISRQIYKYKKINIFQMTSIVVDFFLPPRLESIYLTSRPGVLIGTINANLAAPLQQQKKF